MKDFDIYDAAGSSIVRSFPIYTVAPRSRAYSVNPRTTPGSGGVVTIDGDRLEIPNPIVARILMVADGIASAVDLAYDVIEDARVAGAIRWYQQGQAENPPWTTVALRQPTAGINEARIEFDGPHTFLTLSFLPSQSGELIASF